MNLQLINQQAIDQRNYWIGEISQISGHFGQETSRVQEEVAAEIKTGGIESLHNHLRLCGAIPEVYNHDSSEEKLYSKYTDVLIHLGFTRLGLKSLVLTERSDAADVEVVGNDYSFVADAKAFRLSRTAKNQKDFKIQAMDTWKRGKPYAMVVCPLYQLPSRTSQIYQQAATRNVCVFSYAHLCVLIRVAETAGKTKARKLLNEIFKTVESLNPSKDAVAYWTALNRCILEFDKAATDAWKTEKIAASDSLLIAKEGALTALAKEREAIMRLSHDEALQRLVLAHRLDSREKIIKAVTDNGLMGHN